MRYGAISIIFLVIAFIGFSCKSRAGKHINEGEIHYNIEYNGSISGIPKEMLPKNLVVYFKHNNILVEMLSHFGNSGVIYLLNHEDNIYDVYFNFFTIKYYYEASKGELFPGFDAMEGIKINKTSKTMVICGFHCKNAEVTLPSDRNKIINIWYTNEINVKNSNIATPFKEIEGVMMDFVFYIGEAEIHYSAENVYNKSLNDNVFKRRGNHNKASKEDIKDFINKMVHF